MHGLQLIGGLVIGVGLLIYLIMKTRIHAFPALIIASALVGLIAGMDPKAGAQAIATGFGNTLASIGIVIGLGVMLGKLLEISGAAETMADRFIRLVGHGREHWAMVITGGIVGIPVFADSGYVILTALANSLAKQSKSSRVVMNLALACGLGATHCNVPPTPGPLAAAGFFHIDLGIMILVGLIVSTPMIIGMMIYTNYVGKKVILPDLPEVSIVEGKSLPNAWISFAPIVVPILLILLNTICEALKLQGDFASIAGFIGHPIIAVMAGFLFGLYGLTSRIPLDKVIAEMEDSMASAGIIILITGAGGSLGNVLRESGIGNYVAVSITSLHLPAFLLPFALATLIRIAQGSGTVAMITASSIVAPMMGQLDLHPIVAAFSCTIGSMFFSYFNDSLFWVFTRMNKMTPNQGIQTWSIAITVGWGVGFVCLVVMNLIL